MQNLGWAIPYREDLNLHREDDEVDPRMTPEIFEERSRDILNRYARRQVYYPDYKGEKTTLVRNLREPLPTRSDFSERERQVIKRFVQAILAAPAIEDSKERDITSGLNAPSTFIENGWDIDANFWPEKPVLEDEKNWAHLSGRARWVEEIMMGSSIVLGRHFSFPPLRAENSGGTWFINSFMVGMVFFSKKLEEHHIMALRNIQGFNLDSINL